VQVLRYQQVLVEAVVEVLQLDLAEETPVEDQQVMMVDHQDLIEVVAVELEETVQDHLTEQAVMEQLYQVHLVMHPHLFFLLLV
jgi:hypothetical protein|tara:strand:+ start:155 stop:406 length:252 start_codon:yes stop_codon:yes gene_type:complete